SVLRRCHKLNSNRFQSISAPGRDRLPSREIAGKTCQTPCGGSPARLSTEKSRRRPPGRSAGRQQGNGTTACASRLKMEVKKLAGGVLYLCHQRVEQGHANESRCQQAARKPDTPVVWQQTGDLHRVWQNECNGGTQ